MARRRYLVALTEGELAALRGACSAAEAAGTGGDFSSHDQHMIAQAHRQLDAAEPHEVIVGFSRAEAETLWSMSDMAGDAEDLSWMRGPTLAAGRRAQQLLTQAIGQG